MSWALLLTICAFSAYADRVTGARKALHKNKPEQARKLLDKELARHPQNAGAKYIYALLFLQADSTGSGLDSAHAYLQQAAQFFRGRMPKSGKVGVNRALLTRPLPGKSLRCGPGVYHFASR